ncbi:MAG: GntP family permease [Paenibacillaceae bacterium]|nr:GntP family permease [Paenibacillaceae bacterium]
MNISAFGAIIALVIAIILILKKVEPTYAMIFGAIFGGLLGGAGLAGTVSCMITGVQGIVSAIVRIVTAGILAGVLIESGAAARIAEAIIRKMGSRRSLIAIMLATWCLTAVGVFGDVAVITVAPIAIQLARRSGFKKLGVLMALIGGVKAGNVMSPNPNAIAASEAFHIPLTSTMMAGIVPAVAALITTTLLSRALIHKGSDFDEVEEGVSESELPSLAGAVTGPLVTIILLLLRPLCGITVDPLIALPAGGISGVLAMRKGNHICFYFTSGLKKMSGVAMLLIGTGTLAGIISNSNLKDVIIQGIEYAGLPGFLLAPISGTLMGAATASSTAGTTLASQIFGPTVMLSGISAIAAAVMTHTGSFVFDGLPHGSFFHVSAGALNMDIRERLKLIAYESLNGLAMVALAVLVYGVLRIAG